MPELLDALNDIAAGVADPGLRDIARLGQELLAKQVRQSWELRQDEDQNAWAGLKHPSFAGVLGKKMGIAHGHLLGYKATGEWRFYGKDDLAPHQAESFLSQAALRAIREAVVTDTGFETQEIAKTYWLWQDQGTESTGWGPGIPARPFWGFGDDLLDLMANLLADKAAKRLAA